MAEPGTRLRGNRRRSRKVQRILIPALLGVPPADLLDLSRVIQRDRRIVVLGVVPVEPERSLSKAASSARELRAYLRREYADSDIRVKPKVLVSHNPDFEIAAEVAEENVDLLLLPWRGENDPLQHSVRVMLSHVPCNVAALAGSLPPPGATVLAVLRDGMDSELALRQALELASGRDFRIRTLRLAEDMEAPDAWEATLALEQVLEHIPQVEDALLYTDDPLQAILEEAGHADLMVIGASGGQTDLDSVPDFLATQLVAQAKTPVLIARAQPQPTIQPPDAIPGYGAISILVDKWFAENTFHADEFRNLNRLLEWKDSQDLSISLALPALNEEQTVGNVIRTIQRALQEDVSLLDEIVLMDSNSTDRTRDIAENLGVPVYIHQHVLPQYGERQGKGEALWKSLYVTKGDLVLWIDTDIVNIHPRFIYGLIGPLLMRPDLMFVKGFYLRPMRVGKTVQAGGGGRVTELTARPLLNLFYPALSGLVQPLSGEYGGRRSALEKLPFSSGYGVETGLLIDLLDQYGLSAIGQVDLIKRIHHNQPLTALSMMSFAIIQTVTRKLDRKYGLELLKDINRSMKIIRNQKSRFFLEVERIAERERPPIRSLPEYASRFGDGSP